CAILLSGSSVYRATPHPPVSVYRTSSTPGTMAVPKQSARQHAGIPFRSGLSGPFRFAIRTALPALGNFNDRPMIRLRVSHADYEEPYDETDFQDPSGWR